MTDFSVIVPTYNERANVVELVERLECILGGRAWEVVFVDDDSPDGTADLVRELALRKPHVRCLQRIGRRGLSRAVIEGILSTAAPVIAVMDADLQHDESLLSTMSQRLADEQLDLVVASRYADGGSVAGWDQRRARLSRLGTRLAQRILHTTLTDPMSGFFVMRRELFNAVLRKLSGEGYKLLLDVLASAPRPPRLAEVPYTFRPRAAGKSKLDSAVAWEFVLLLIDKRVGKWIPARFVLFSCVGASGVLVHFAALWLVFRGLGLDFALSQTVATLLAMTSNYALNDSITYRDRRHRGLRWIAGLMSFYAVCGLGVVANVGVASALFDRDHGWLAAAAAGALIGTVWNYVVTAAVTWKRR
jgi:dolichol-phosphate mannosyltransferase